VYDTHQDLPGGLPQPAFRNGRQTGKRQKQRLKDSLEKKGNFKASKAVESGRIPKKDK
jgi:hypothetical protein